MSFRYAGFLAQAIVDSSNRLRPNLTITLRNAADTADWPVYVDRLKTASAPSSFTTGPLGVIAVHAEPGDVLIAAVIDTVRYTSPFPVPVDPFEGESDVADEATLRSQADVAEAAARAAQDTAEATARATAVSAEASARTSADTAEASARGAADAALAAAVADLTARVNEGLTSGWLDVASQPGVDPSGLSECSAAIHTARDLAASQGRGLDFGDGHYLVTSIVNNVAGQPWRTMPLTLILHAAGSETTTVRLDAAGTRLFGGGLILGQVGLQPGSGSGHHGIGYGADDVLADDIRVEDYRNYATYAYRDCNRLHLRRLRTRNHRWSAVFLAAYTTSDVQGALIEDLISDRSMVPETDIAFSTLSIYRDESDVGSSPRGYQVGHTILHPLIRLPQLSAGASAQPIGIESRGMRHSTVIGGRVYDGEMALSLDTSDDNLVIGLAGRDHRFAFVEMARSGGNTLVGLDGEIDPSRIVGGAHYGYIEDGSTVVGRNRVIGGRLAGWTHPAVVAGAPAGYAPSSMTDVTFVGPKDHGVRFVRVAGGGKFYVTGCQFVRGEVTTGSPETIAIHADGLTTDPVTVVVTGCHGEGLTGGIIAEPHPSGSLVTVVEDGNDLGAPFVVGAGSGTVVHRVGSELVPSQTITGTDLAVVNRQMIDRLAQAGFFIDGTGVLVAPAKGDKGDDGTSLGAPASATVAQGGGVVVGSGGPVGPGAFEYDVGMDAATAVATKNDLGVRISAVDNGFVTVRMPPLLTPPGPVFQSSTAPLPGQPNTARFYVRVRSLPGDTQIMRFNLIDAAGRRSASVLVTIPNTGGSYTTASDFVIDIPNGPTTSPADTTGDMTFTPLTDADMATGPVIRAGTYVADQDPLHMTTATQGGVDYIEFQATYTYPTAADLQHVTPPLLDPTAFPSGRQILFRPSPTDDEVPLVSVRLGSGVNVWQANDGSTYTYP